jgi:hypothetical protein
VSVRSEAICGSSYTISQRLTRPAHKGDPAHPYLGEFHNQINTTQFATYLGYSTDLSVWHTLGQIHSAASQPDMRILPDDSVLYAEEYNGRSSVARQPDCFLRDATAADARGSRRPALVFTCFVFGANNGATPPGGHLSRNRKKISV